MDVNVRDYGAIGNDVHDDTLAFKNALNAIRSTGGTCHVPAGTYRIIETGIMNSNSGTPAVGTNMHLVGELNVEGIPVSILHVHGKALKTILTCGGSGFSVEKITISMSGLYEYNPTPPPEHIPGAGPLQVIGESSGWLIDRCKILNTGHFALIVRGKNFKISNNHFAAYPYTFGTGAHPLHEGMLFQPVSGIWPSHGTIINNVTEGVGYNIGGDNLSFIRNIVLHPGSGAGFFSKGEAFNHDYLYIGNIVQFAEEGLDNAQRDPDGNPIFFQVEGYEIWSDHTLMLKNIAHDNCGGGFIIGGRNSVVAFNRAVDNGRVPGTPPPPGYSHGHRTGFSAHTLKRGNTSINASGTIFIGNIATDTRPQEGKTQSYGYATQDNSPNIRCVSVVGNNFHGNELGEGKYNQTQPNVSAFVGRDMGANMLDAKQIDILKSLLDPDKYSLSESEYVMLNEFLFGSSLDRPVLGVTANEETGVSRWRFTASWSITNTATGYQITVARDIGFGNVLDTYNNLNVGNVRSKVVTVPHNDPMPNGQQYRRYFYRVRGFNSTKVGPYSNIITVDLPA